MISAQKPQVIGAPALHEAQIIGVINNAGKVRILVIDANRHDMAAVVNSAIEVRMAHEAVPSGFGACARERTRRSRNAIQISAMITPGMVRLSRGTLWMSGRPPVASSANRASSF